MTARNWTAADMPSQAGRLALVTGANSGIGYQTALGLARAGAEVVLAVRDPARGEAVARRIGRDAPGAAIRVEPLDLASLASIRALGARLRAQQERLDVLVNNAAVMALPRREATDDGFERQFGVNFLGHFLLTAELMPMLRAGPAPRVVQLSSLAHRRGRIHFKDLQGERRYSPWRAYCQSKLAMLMFALELDRRAGGTLLSVAAHPGWARSRLIATGMGWSPVGTISRLMWPLIAQSAAAGALPILYAATAPGVAGGGYYGPLRLGETRGAPGPARIAPQAQDAPAAARLWDAAVHLTGADFDI